MRLTDATDETHVIFKISQKLLRNIKHLKKTGQKLEKIERSESLSLHQTGRILIHELETTMLAADFLYVLQQTKSRLSLEYYKVLDVSSELTCITYAKQFLALSRIEKLQLLENESDNEKKVSQKTQIFW